MSRILASYNIKGGVGKTSTVVNLAYLAARQGARTLLWDLDPQGASTFLLRIKPKVRGGGGKLVAGRTEIGDLIRGADLEGLDLLPADFSYRRMELALDATKKPQRRLGRLLAPLAEEYDYIFLDCPPGVSLVSESVFAAADSLLVPLIPAALSMRTFPQLERVAAGGPQVLAFFSMVDGRKRMHREVMEAMGREHTDLLATVIPAASEIERMGLHRSPVAEFAPRGRAALAYQALWHEVQERCDGRPPGGRRR
ncbi:MAG: chromosome partitioning protein [Solirubrobacteraceae bacterium]|jgi:cellulose biosynthesis protein BcsQ|nr:chromosome partitioning protein [Solirubrobacteraceae bacterium]